MVSLSSSKMGGEFLWQCFWLPSPSGLDTAADSGIIVSSTFSTQPSSYLVWGCWDKSPEHRWKSGPAGSNTAPFEGNERWGQLLVVTIYLKGPRSCPPASCCIYTKGGIRHTFVLGWCSEAPSTRAHASGLGFGRPASILKIHKVYQTLATCRALRTLQE